MKTAVIGPTLHTYYGIEEIAKYCDIKALFTLPLKQGLRKARYATFEDQADKYGFEIFHDEHNLDDSKVTKRFRDLDLDLIIELGSSKIIPAEIIESSRYGCIGSHGAKLPYIRGGASMNWAIINGENEWGVSIFYLTPGIDEGILISTANFDINNQDTINTVHDKSDYATMRMLGEFLNNFKPKEEFEHQELEIIKLNPSPKDADFTKIMEWNEYIKSKYKEYKSSNKRNAIFLPQRKPQDGIINWNSQAREIYNFIRAQTGPYFPGAFTMYKGKKLFVLDSELDFFLSVNHSRYKPGTIIDILDNIGILVKTSYDYLRLTRVRLEGMPEMWADDFFHEATLKAGDIIYDF